MPTDLQIALRLMAQYNGETDCFDYVNRIENVSFAVTVFPDYSEVLCEGSFNAPDWFSNFECKMVQTSIGGVEEGFEDGTDDVIDILAQKLPKDKPVFLGGHSRGSAHADILAAKLILHGYKVTVIVFGSPRAGDHVFATLVMKADARRAYKNRNDPVTCVPEPLLIPHWPYIHPTPLIPVNVAAPAGDDWLLLKDHHFYLYLAAMKGLANV